jgi:hypothetical protein
MPVERRPARQRTRRPPLLRRRLGRWRLDCLAGVVGFELANVGFKTRDIYSHTRNEFLFMPRSHLLRAHCTHCKSYHSQLEVAPNVRHWAQRGTGGVGRVRKLGVKHATYMQPCLSAFARDRG